jgi:putative endopeptidase
MIKDVPAEQWQAYFRAHTIDGMAPYLSDKFADERFDFFGKTLRGQQEQKPRWKRVLDTTEGGVGEALGQMYVKQYFPPESKAEMTKLVDNLRASLKARLEKLDWMSADTRTKAIEKWDSFMPKIGYPDKWRSWDGLATSREGYVQNVLSATKYNYDWLMGKVGKPVDRTEWGMTPQTINAYYSGNKNEIVFPAAILQPPFFNVAADDAVNYGAIGAVIGHEISHGFDDKGSQLDGDGRLRNWWTDEDRKAFEAVTSRLVAQYEAYSPIPGQHLNGKLTLGENIADLSGLQIAYKAWKLSLHGKPAPVIDGITGEQRFFYGFAQVWRNKTRDERALQLLTIDPHSPGQFRADGATINADAYHDAFRTRPGDKMWKAPADRLRLW